MTIEVQFFSRLRDLAGTSRLDYELPEGATIADLLAQLFQRFPTMRAWDAHLLLAVGLDYAPRDQVLRTGDSVSVMPPVQGG
jgi:molybdopterin synthase catalytic subunit